MSKTLVLIEENFGNLSFPGYFRATQKCFSTDEDNCIKVKVRLLSSAKLLQLGHKIGSFWEYYSLTWLGYFLGVADVGQTPADDLYCLCIGLCSISASPQRTGSGSGTAPTAPRRNTPITTSSGPQTVFYTGRVVLDTGVAPPSSVGIVRSCNGLSRRQAFSTSDGSFSFMVGDSLREATPDASDDNRGFGPDNQLPRSSANSFNQNPQSLMADCELRAELAGYSSSSLRLDPSMTNSNVGVIVLHSRTKKAEGMITVASLEVPSKARKEYEKGSELLEKGNLPEAEKSFRKAIDQYPDFAEAWTRLGDLEQRRKDTDAATKDYEQAISADPKLPVPYLRMAFLEASASNWERTLKFTDKLIALDPTDFPIAYYFNAVAEFNLKNFTKAESSALRAESMDTAHAEPRVELLLASIYSAKQAYSTAAEHYRAYLKIVPDGPQTARVKTDLAKTEEMAKSQPPPNPSQNK